MTRRLARFGLWIVLLACGFVLALRSWRGPFSLGIRVDSPMNVEAAAGLIIVIALAVRSRPSPDDGESDRVRPAFGVWAGAVSLLLLTASAYWRTIHLSFLSDDFNLPMAGSSASVLNFRNLFAVDSAYGFYRPIARISFALNSIWGGNEAAAWRACNLVLHSANSMLVLVLASRLCATRVAAFFAAALFSVHGTRPEAVVWIAGRFDLMATLFVLSGLTLFEKSLRVTAERGRVYRAFSLACMVLAILSKESAYAFPLLLALILISRDGKLRGRIGAAAPFFLVAAGLLAHRLVSFGGLGGYPAGESGQSGALAYGLLPALKALVPRLWAVLFFPINWSAKPGALIAVLSACSVLCFGLLAESRIGRRKTIFVLGFVIVSALPPLHLLLIGADLEKSRLLYLPSVGFCILLALAAEKLRGRMSLLAPGLILAFNLAALEHNLEAWEDASAKAQSACAAAADCVGPSTKKVVVIGLPAILRGVYFFGNGFEQCVRMRLGAAVPQMEFRPGGTSTDGGSVRVLRWDESSGGLRCLEKR